MSTAEIDELKKFFKPLFESIHFDIGELRHDMNEGFDHQDVVHNQILQTVEKRFDHQDAIHNQILQAVGERFEGDESKLHDHDRRYCTARETLCLKSAIITLKLCSNEN